GWFYGRFTARVFTSNQVYRMDCTLNAKPISIDIDTAPKGIAWYDIATDEYHVFSTVAFETGPNERDCMDHFNRCIPENQAIWSIARLDISSPSKKHVFEDYLQHKGLATKDILGGADNISYSDTRVAVPSAKSDAWFYVNGNIAAG